MKRRRISYKKEPVLKAHRYIVECGHASSTGWKTRVFYCMNLKEVRLLCSQKMPKGSVIEVFRATHNFIKGWEIV